MHAVIYMTDWDTCEHSSSLLASLRALRLKEGQEVEILFDKNSRKGKVASPVVAQLLSSHPMATNREEKGSMEAAASGRWRVRVCVSERSMLPRGRL